MINKFLPKISKNITSDFEKRKNIFSIFTFYGGILFILFSFWHILSIQYKEGLAELAMGLILIVSYYYYQKNIYIKVLQFFFFLSILTFFLIMVITGGLEGSGILYVFLFPILCFFVKGKKEGLWWIIVFILIYILLIILKISNIIFIQYNNMMLFICLIILILENWFILKYESIIELEKDNVNKKNEKLKKLLEFYKEFIKEKKETQKIKEKTLIELNKNNEMLENTKKAMLNLLEDVEEEKNISQMHAQDLEKYKLAVENASDQIIITDPDGKILYANRIVKDYTGYSKDEVIGKTPALWGRNMSKNFYKNMWDVIKKYKTVFTDEVTNTNKNGEKYIAQIYISPILDKNNKVIFFVGIERDITKEKEIDTAKTEFVSLASHQLRTPLSAINWYSELLLSGDTGKITKEQKDYLQEISSSSKKMADLVNALLNVSRIEMGTFVIDPKNIDIVSLCKDTIKEFEIKKLDKNIQIVENYNPKKIFLKVDINLMRIIFQNLISNAIKYNKQNGKVEIFISKEDKFVSIKVTDSGLGIPKKQQDKIFTKLFRADNIKKTSTEGTGLGLYIIKSVLEKSGGVIWFKSTENKGTTFYVSIPLTGMKEKRGEKTLN